MVAIHSKIPPWLEPVDLAATRHGVDRALLFAVLDRESECGTSRWLDKPGPGGCGDRSPRLWSRYAKRSGLEQYVKRWRPTQEAFQKHFPEAFKKLEPGKPIPEVCMPADGRGWGRGAFQHDLLGDFTPFGGETNLEFCLRRLRDGRFAWEDATEGANRAAILLRTAINAFDHDERLAACAYNAGIQAVQRKLLAISSPATLEKRHAAADSCTTGRDYGADVMRRRKEFRKHLNPTR